LIELLKAAALANGGALAAITDDRTVTYRELHEEALSVAAGLSAHRIDRFGVIHQDAATVIALLAGASLAGAEACVYPPIERPETARELTERFDHTVVVSETAGLGAGMNYLTPRQLHESPASAPAQPPPNRPLLVLTTGTTGAPRGARHDWNRMLRPLRRIAPAPGQRWLLAYGLQQFGALQVLLHCAAAGATLIAPFPRRPREGLAAMRRHDVTHVSATPTFWRFLLADVRSDGGPVPALRQITLGGEAVPAGLLDSLADAFPHARISQVYAITEFGSQGSVRDGRNGLPAALLEREDGDIAIKVVDGELWMRSRVGMLGYYGERPLDPDGWRATGDLVEIVGDRIMFRGRASEIINVGGVKVHPLPIEERIGAVPGVQLAHVHGRANPLTGAIVAAEVVATPGSDEETVREAIRAACADLPPAARPRSIRIVESIAITEQKIKRGASRE
jgi:acyl-CoA synthetase (AMP-forming)/AMP-acid ligase II